MMTRRTAAATLSNAIVSLLLLIAGIIAVRVARSSAGHARRLEIRANALREYAPNAISLRKILILLKNN